MQRVEAKYEYQVFPLVCSQRAEIGLNFVWYSTYFSWYF